LSPSSYNIYEACEKMWGTELKQMILDRDGTLVVRPDSGEPKIIVVEVLTILEKQFGSTKNEQVRGEYKRGSRKE
jgi:nicotinamide phosphoribosyltransferase